MSIWAGIKYALNSTIGTKDFEPLDKLLSSNYTLVASDTALKYIVSPYDTPIKINKTENPTYSFEFTPNLNGVIRIQVSHKSGGYYFYVTQNDEVLIKNSTVDNTGGDESNYHFDFNVNANMPVTCRFTFRNSASIGGYTETNLTRISICGSTIGGRVFTENEVE